ncbi:hypothetical protein CesoFtcFv8_025822 [Champsocephalus esox]|uniref:Uncharacterized protein n=1 Tax=Champsocephalus esox TaxID=159716 RepID=A0AAN8GBT0_9TELE|nr:hypothetical protein CesoFtcFv8_025822 [Champsocephalus esox]
MPYPHDSSASLLIRSWAPRSGVLDQTPPPDLSVISSVRCTDSGPLPDPPTSSHRNACNEALWGPDAERAAGQKQPATLT